MTLLAVVTAYYSLLCLLVLVLGRNPRSQPCGSRLRCRWRG